MSRVIAVAGPVGAGKSSLVHALGTRLPDAATLHFDSYERMTERPIGEIVEWLRSGADLDAMIVPGLARDLERLRDGHSVRDPQTGRSIEPRESIVFEMPLGRQHGPTAGLIDLVLWIDTPFDVALARRLREYALGFIERGDPARTEEFIGWIDGYLENYLAAVAELLRIQEQRVRPDADAVLDGRLAPNALLEAAVQAIEASRRPPAPSRA